MQVRLELKLGWACGDNCCYDYDYETEIVEMSVQDFITLRKAWQATKYDELEVNQAPVDILKLTGWEGREDEYNYIRSVEAVDSEVEGLCSCGEEGSYELQVCPYSEEIGGNDTPSCYCCSKCTHQCAMDI